MKHALVIGGTGMLAETTIWLAGNGYHASVLARNRRKTDKLLEQSRHREHLTPILVDYHNLETLKQRLRENFEQYGTPSIVVAWIHSDAEKTRDIIIQEVSKTFLPFDLYIILGSSTNREVFRQNIAVPEHCTLHIIQLGFVIENNDSRWLTHNEIAGGVIEAIKHEKVEHIVGVLEPWNRRP
ncbi:short-chain dehydrogenase [Halobacillus sp. MO56]